jgi:hypothetical protein
MIPPPLLAIAPQLSIRPRGLNVGQVAISCRSDGHTCCYLSVAMYNLGLDIQLSLLLGGVL